MDDAESTWDTDDPDVVLDVPTLQVEEIDLEVEDLHARVSLQAEVLDLLKLNVGADVDLGKVQLTIKGVEAQALLKVRLDNVSRIIERVLETIDNNPEIVQSVTRAVGTAAGEVGSGARSALGEVGRGAGGAVEGVGQGAGTAAGELGQGAGEAVGGVGEGAGAATGALADSAGGAVQEAGQAVSETTGTKKKSKKTSPGKKKAHSDREGAPEKDASEKDRAEGDRPPKHSAKRHSAKRDAAKRDSSRSAESSPSGSRTRRRAERAEGRDRGDRPERGEESREGSATKRIRPP